MPTQAKPLVAILMGSDSDWPIMEEAARTCATFGVPCEARVISAHRRPAECAEYARRAADRGLKVVIAGAGGAAHLAGTLAAHTTLPVVAVPIPTALAGGLDSLLSTVQMPTGVPVATVGVGRAGNAAILAIQILALADPELGRKLAAFKDELRAQGVEADRKVQENRDKIGTP